MAMPIGIRNFGAARESTSVLEVWVDPATGQSVPGFPIDVQDVVDTYRGSQNCTAWETVDVPKPQRKKPNPFRYVFTRDWYLQGGETSYSVYAQGHTRLVSHTGTRAGTSIQLEAPWDLSTDEIHNKLWSDLLDGWRNSGNFNLPVFAAELHKTLAMGKQAYLLAKLLTRRLESIGKGVSYASSAAASAWLAYKYGITPVINDIQGVKTLWGSPYIDSFPFQKRGSRRSNTERRNGTQLVKAANFAAVKVGGVCQLGNPLLAYAERVGLLNPLSAAWELVPFSFVADWFYDVGGLLNLGGAALSGVYTITNGYETTFTRSLQAYTDVSATQVGENWSLKDLGALREKVSCQRVIVSSLPGPRLPRLHVPSGASRLLSAAALLRQVGLDHPDIHKVSVDPDLLKRASRRR